MAEPQTATETANVPMSATTTSQQDLVTAGQRRVNLIWESVQGLIAVMITGAVIFNGFYEVDSPVLNNAFFLIVSMYFVRTNHVLMGGTGPKTGER